MRPPRPLSGTDPGFYDRTGAGYTATRRTDPRLAARIWAALGDARTVLNVGAGAGSYEPGDRVVVAVEPSAVMAAQRPAGAAPVVRGEAINTATTYGYDSVTMMQETKTTICNVERA